MKVQPRQLRESKAASHASPLTHQKEIGGVAGMVSNLVSIRLLGINETRVLRARPHVMIPCPYV